MQFEMMNHFKTSETFPPKVYHCDTNHILCPDKNLREIKEKDEIIKFYSNKLINCYTFSYI